MKKITILIIFSLLTLMIKAQSVKNDTLSKLQSSQSKVNGADSRSDNTPALSVSGTTNKSTDPANKPELLNMSMIKNSTDTIQKVDSLKKVK